MDMAYPNSHAKSCRNVVISYNYCFNREYLQKNNLKSLNKDYILNKKKFQPFFYR